MFEHAGVEPMDCSIRIRLTRSERDHVEARATRANLTISAYARGEAVGVSVVARADHGLADEIGSHGSLFMAAMRLAGHDRDHEIRRVLCLNERLVTGLVGSAAGSHRSRPGRRLGTGRGVPSPSGAERPDHAINFRLTQSEMNDIEARAKEANMLCGEYARARVLGLPVVARGDRQMASVIRRFVGLLKLALHVPLAPALRAEIRRVRDLNEQLVVEMLGGATSVRESRRGRAAC